MYELHVAQTLNMIVKLCPHIRDGDVLAGYLDSDVCIKYIENRVDSISAYCSYDPDKQRILKAILSQSKDGFDEINASVERIRLWYLLYYPLYKINNPGPDWLYYRFDIPSRYITVFVYSLIIGLVAFLFGFHLGIIVLPLVGLFLDFLVRFIDHDGLTSRWKNYTEGRTLGRNIFHWILYSVLYVIMFVVVRPFVHLVVDTMEDERRAVETLARAIVVVVERAYSFGHDDLPKFQEHCDSWPRLYYWAPMFVYRMWRNKVKQLIRKSDRNGGSVKDAKETTAIQNETVNESTPLIHL